MTSPRRSHLFCNRGSRRAKQTRICGLTMAGIIGVIAFLTVLGISLVITRVVTAALMLTGLSHEAARFQARSAFTGTGFTTSEAEKVVNHPVRRRIIMGLMFIRSAGLITIVISLILSFGGSGSSSQRAMRILWLAGGVLLLWLISMSKIVDRHLSRAIQWSLNRWTELDVADYASMLRLSGEYRVIELQVEAEDWLAGKNLANCNLRQEGITILGITRPDGSYVGVPHRKTEIGAGDVLILYGRAENLKELSTRRTGTAGDDAHSGAIGIQEQKLREQDQQEQNRSET